jgi:hypothetical protein
MVMAWSVDRLGRVDHAGRASCRKSRNGISGSKGTGLHGSSFAAGLAALTVVVVSLLAAGKGNAG